MSAENNLMQQTALVAVMPSSWELAVVKSYREKNNIREASIAEYDKMSTGWKEAYRNAHMLPLGIEPHDWNLKIENRNHQFYAAHLRTDGTIGHPVNNPVAILCPWPTHATREFIAANGYLVTDEDKKLLEMVKAMAAAMAAAPVRVVEKKASHLLLVSALRGQLKS